MMETPEKGVFFIPNPAWRADHEAVQ
jgi:hypothetical protein